MRIIKTRANLKVEEEIWVAEVVLVAPTDTERDLPKIKAEISRRLGPWALTKVEKGKIQGEEP